MVSKMSNNSGPWQVGFIFLEPHAQIIAIFFSNLQMQLDFR
jgi:hypothetical protein